ncbi:DUF6086 family protein [Streptomyces sp. NPDC008079]|uniref:DUF6086 family protein n=1 Tax=Streptomyces sp. NPDC008079 TaxID=3364806 RepID=UPI0036F0B44E
MSQYYEVGDRVLWNPSTGVSRLFHGQVPVFEERVGVASGIGPMVNDDCRVDPAALAVFAQALLDWDLRVGHSINRALSEGFVGTVLALASRAGVTLTWPSLPDLGRGARLRRLARELEQVMPGDRP